MTDQKQYPGAPCPTCNKGLGLFRDQPELLETAAEYLRKK